MDCLSRRLHVHPHAARGWGKAQAFLFPLGEKHIFCVFLMIAIPVSYTHLDVYKRQLLKLPPHYRMELLISIGYPQGAPRQRRLRPMEEMLHYNTD